MAGLNMEVKLPTRLCTVKGEFGYFHLWEHYSKPIEASPMIGGAPTGVVSKVFGIVEFSDRTVRVDPTEIVFCDEDSTMLQHMEAKRKEETT